ncbi:CHAP domain-containing protein [Nocardia cyriacigeorgica]|uniref:CHAP domain-containing protein n=1 Tax=Nocardia cyriacigeorgica TaxID=135487 RepID=A0A5R8NMB2_9NOCA|nr:CHAP domain-containing protein [Nocardia cyriacigeorgica]TLF75757.1 CHAP domain-containing protein [Nocardia cyriacigeorgica]
MSLQTDLAEIDGIPVRGDFPPGLVSVVRMVKHALRASVMQFASGEPAAQPDLLEQLRKAKLLRNSDIDGVEAKTVILEKYGSRKSDFQAIENELDTKGKRVDGSVSETFSTADGTYRQVMGKVRTLSEALANAPGPSKDQDYIAPHVAGRLAAIALRTTGDVHDLIDDASTRIQEKANAIRAATQGAKPVMANAASTMGGRSPISVPSGGAAPASYTRSSGSSPYPTPWTANAASFSPSTGVAAIDAAIRAAEGEIGVSEYADNRVNRPYNINNEWCASFTDWAWTQAGMDVNWTNKNLVSAVWSDARRWGWADNVSGARPGDMIVWGHQNHIGLVVARNGNTVTVVEGNSGKAVQRNTYSLDRGFAGVIHPPASSAQVAV